MAEAEPDLELTWWDASDVLEDLKISSHPGHQESQDHPQGQTETARDNQPTGQHPVHVQLRQVRNVPDHQPVLEHPQHGSQPEVQPDDQETEISVLVLTTRWQFDTYGLPTVTRSLVNNLRVVDPDTNFIQITCAVLEEEGKIKDAQIQDAAKHGVNLIGAKKPRGSRKNPKLTWINTSVNKYYPHLVSKDKPDFIIGHIPYSANGCLNLRDIITNIHQGRSTKVILVVHALPLTDEGDVDEECLTEWLGEADLVLSVGAKVQTKLESCIEANDVNVDHKLYLPGFPLDFFKIEQHEHQLLGEQRFLLMTRERENLDVPGLNFELAVLSTVNTSRNILAKEKSDLSKQLSFSLKLIAAKAEEKESWKQNFKDIKDKYKIHSGVPAFYFEAPQDVNKVIPHLKTASVLVLPLKYDSPLFGTEALVAIAAGVPVLVSRNTGIASFLQSIGEAEPIIWDNEDVTKDAQIWKDRLVQKIIDPEKARLTARELRKSLLLGAKISSTHLEFIKTITGKIK